MSELIVYLREHRAGRLIRKDNGNLQFRYDAGYAGPPVSYALPVQADAHPHALCRAVFGGLLPEGDGRQALARMLRVSSDNDYGLLAEIGGDCAGAVTLLPPGSLLPAEPHTRPIGWDELESLLHALPQRPLAASPEQGVRLSLAGAQPKLPIIIEMDERTGVPHKMALPSNAAAATTHILKPEPVAFPGLVDNEAFCMELARAAGLQTARVTKAGTGTGLSYLVVERYDRDLTSDPIRRLHQEDVCQALGIPADRKYQSEGGPGVRETVELLRSATAVPALDLPRLWEGLIFNWLIGNCDAHGKNFSLLYDAGAPTLAPLYDLVSTTSYDLTTRLAMKIDGATHLEEIGLDTWQRLAKEVGVSVRYAERALTQLVTRVQIALRDVADDPQHQNEIAARIGARIRSVRL